MHGEARWVSVDRSSSSGSDAAPSAVRTPFWRLFWQRPRPHGEQRLDREVSFLELFYDLVYVVLISQAAGALAHHLSWHAFGNFVVVFALVWIAWVNGTWYHELHAREDGRSRAFLFLQMLIIAPLAAFTGGAASVHGHAFALTYAGLMMVFMWLWWSVRCVDTPEYHGATGVYLVTMLMLTAAMITSAFVDAQVRIWMWAAYAAVWIIGVLVMRRVATQQIFGSSVAATSSLVERMDLFVIIVLGEVVVGVVSGLSASPVSAIYIVTALAGMLVAFGLWWMYFDFAGQRVPRVDGYTRWVLIHLPLTFGIAAVGACMVNLVHRAPEESTPAAAAWITATSFCIAVVSLAVIYLVLEDAHRHRRLYRKLVGGALLAVPAALLIAALHPYPALLLGALALLLTTLWWLSVWIWMRSDTPVRSWPPGLHSSDAS